MSCAFDLFSIPSGWEQFMCFNFLAKGADLGLDAEKFYFHVAWCYPWGGVHQ